ncbi:hypothetical protein Q1695_014228 [Nippostrongylus brasiliensis]|nr:hypothetical protein Q1695_014228 [Nippostrongylus brasiliensis]
MFQVWNIYVTRMVNLCSNATESCLQVYYERLVQRPTEEAHRILDFLDVPWSDDVLKHEQKIGDEIRLNPSEFSTSQVKEKVNMEALSAWYDCYTDDVLAKIDTLAPMLRRLGYDTRSRRPSYEEFAADDFYERPQRS